MASKKTNHRESKTQVKNGAQNQKKRGKSTSERGNYQ